jgi:hypothetical protein
MVEDSGVDHGRGDRPVRAQHADHGQTMVERDDAFEVIEM